MYHTKYIAEVLSLNRKKTKGKILLSVKKNSIVSNITIDDELMVRAAISKINSPLNPHQFNYAAYMQTLGVYHQVRVSKLEILKQLKGVPTLRGKSESIRNFIIQKLENTVIKPNELSIIQALILGQKKEINKKLYTDYA